MSEAAAPNFQQAMEITAQWLNLWEAGELSDEVLADRVAELVASRDGARGFFVISLAGDSPLMDRLPDPLQLQLRAANPKCEVQANMVDTTTAPRAHLKFGARNNRARPRARAVSESLSHRVRRAQWTAPIWISPTHQPVVFVA